MKKKKILVHGTLDSLQKFFADAVSRDYEIVALLSDEPEKISVAGLDVLKPQNLNGFALNLVDGIIFTGEDQSMAEIFLSLGLEAQKIILWDAEQGWNFFGGQAEDGSQYIFFCGLTFHIKNDDDAKFFDKIHWRLQNQWQIKNLNPQFYPELLRQSFQERMGRDFDFNEPKTFTEKLQWLKIFDATPIKSRLADKYLVRRWIADKIGEEYLIPLLGVWDNFDDINFDDLPDQFVLKCNHGSGMNIIVRDKKTFNIENAREKLNAWIAMDYAACPSLELHYTRINRKIIAEKFMANGNDIDLTDYKFWCFDGKPTYCKCMTERSSDLRIDYFDMNWQHMSFEQDNHPRSAHPEKIRRPKNFKLMKKLAATLAEGFSFVRVDFYEIDGRVYFGEMTFTPGAGNFYYKSEGTDEYLGNLLTMPPITPPHSLLIMLLAIACVKNLRRR